MVDNAPTHNFMKEEVIVELGLKLELAKKSFKVVNLEVEKVVGLANGVTVNLGKWNGIVSFTVIPLDDLEMVLGKEFMRTPKEGSTPNIKNLVMFLR